MNADPPKYKKLSKNSMISLGCDPEIFIEKDGRVVGAEQVLPKNGIKEAYGNDVIIDGIQAELNPAPSTCRAMLGNNIKACLNTLNRQISAKGFQLCNAGTIEMSKEEMEKVSEENRRLGCGPSFNAYDSAAKVIVNQQNQFRRSAGGHIHMACHPDPKVIIPILDLFVGNTCVLIDRDPNQKLRRQQYGRAGEYRLPKHGFEYRTPSNFWLRSFQLMGLVTGLCRMAYRVSGDSANATIFQQDPEPKAIQWLTENTNREMVVDAINNNDKRLAYLNWRTFRRFIETFIPHESEPTQNYGCFPLWPKMLNAFEFFVDKGIDHWWPNKDIVKTWNKVDNGEPGHGYNWEGWFDAVAQKAYNAHLAAQPGHQQLERAR